jgi:hypothetical protein
VETPAAYRRHAVTCLELARRADPVDKARLLGAAEAWRSLAERAEQRRIRETAAAAFGIRPRLGRFGRSSSAA